MKPINRYLINALDFLEPVWGPVVDFADYVDSFVTKIRERGRGEHIIKTYNPVSNQVEIKIDWSKLKK